MAGILAEETAETLLVATIYNHLSIQSLLQRSLVCISPNSEPMETQQATFTNMEEPGIREAGARDDCAARVPPPILWGKLCINVGVSHISLSGANAFWPLPLLRKQSVGMVSLWF